MGAVVVAILAGTLPRFWLGVGAAGVAVLGGLSWVANAVEWWGGPPDCSGEVPAGFPCQPPLPPPLSPVPALAVAVGFFALGAVFVYLGIRAKRQRVTTR